MGVFFSTQNVNIVLRKAAIVIFRVGVDFSELSHYKGKLHPVTKPVQNRHRVCLPPYLLYYML